MHQDKKCRWYSQDWGTDDITMTPVGGGQPAHYAGHGVSILHRDPDNTWRFASGINNATLRPS